MCSFTKLLVTATLGIVISQEALAEQKARFPFTVEEFIDRYHESSRLIGI